MNPIKKINDHFKAKWARERRVDIEENFKITERNGSLWLIHFGIAFKEFPKNIKAQEIAKELKEARETALKFEGFTPTNATEYIITEETEH